MSLPLRITHRDKYWPAMEVTEQLEADVMFETLVQHSIALGATRKEAENTERENLAYFAGYYEDEELRKRVERLYRCSHPVFGPAE